VPYVSPPGVLMRDSETAQAGRNLSAKFRCGS